MADNQTTLDIVIRMLAQGDGAKVTAQQIKELSDQAEALNRKTQRTPGEDRQLGNIKNVVEALKGSSQVVQAAAEAGEKVGEEVGKGVGSKLDSAIQRALASVAGRLSGLPGIGNLLGAGGLLGAGVGAGIGLVEKGIDVLIAKFTELQERMKVTADVATQLRQVQAYSPGVLRQYQEAADRLADVNHNATKWLGTMGAIARMGSDPATVQKLTGHVKELANLLDGDLATATKIVTDGLQGNYEGYRLVGIAIDSQLSSVHAMASAQQQVAARQSEFANAAVSSAPKLRQMQAAAEAVAAGINMIKTASDEAAASLQRMLAEIEQTKGDNIRKLDAEEKLALLGVDKQFAQGNITREQADARKAAIQQDFAGRRLGEENKASDAVIAERTKEFESANDEWMQAIEDLRVATERVAKAMELEQQSIALQPLREQIAKLERSAADPREVREASDPEGKRVAAREFAARREKELAEKKELEDRLRQAEAAIEAERKRSGVSSRTEEQAALEEQRKGTKEIEDRKVKQMQDAERAIKEEERRKGRRGELFDTDTKARTTAAEVQAILDRKAADERLRGEARNWSKRAMDAQEKGLPEPPMSPELKGRRWQFDAETGNVRWLGALEAIGNTVEQMADETIRLQRRVEVALGRIKNDGTRT